MIVAPDGKKAVVAGDGKLMVYSLTADETHAAVKLPMLPWTFSADSNYLAVVQGNSATLSTSSPITLRILDCSSWSQVRVDISSLRSPEPYTIVRLQWHPRQSTLVCFGAEHMRSYDAEGRQLGAYHFDTGALVVCTGPCCDACSYSKCKRCFENFLHINVLCTACVCCCPTAALCPLRLA